MSLAWLLGVIVAIVGVVWLLQGSVIVGIVLIVVGLLVAGYLGSAFHGPRRL